MASFEECDTIWEDASIAGKNKSWVFLFGFVYLFVFLSVFSLVLF